MSSVRYTPPFPKPLSASGLSKASCAGGSASRSTMICANGSQRLFSRTSSAAHAIAPGSHLKPESLNCMFRSIDQAKAINSSLDGKQSPNINANIHRTIACSWSCTFSLRIWTGLAGTMKGFSYRKVTGRTISLSRVMCEAKDGENKKETGASSSTMTEEPEEKSEAISSSQTPPASSPSPPLEGGHRAGLKNVQLDAFKFMELVGPEKVDPEDVKLLKEKVFGYTTFWVVGQEPFGDIGEGVLFLGNLRGQREDVFAKLQRSLREFTGNKYDLFMIEEPNSEEPDPRGGPRVSFVLLRKEVSDPGPTTLWQYVIAVALFALTAGACLELGIATQISRLPPEVVRYFINPEVSEPPNVQLLLPYVESALPLAYGVFGVQFFHEVGHRLVAAPCKVKMGIPYLIPNITLGSFGAITQFKSICPDRVAKFDVSMAGPFAGGVLSAAMLGVGLLISTNAGPEELVQIPSIVFQGSLLLGVISRMALGYDLTHAATVAIHPLVIAGWCGLTTTAFNLLPVGCIDGGRAMQASFGKTALNVTGILTYLLLGLGVLGGPLSLPWGLYILIVQRSPEKLCLNDVTGVGSWRKVAHAFGLVLVVMTLLPLWDSLAEDLGIGLASAPLL